MNPLFFNHPLKMRLWLTRLWLTGIALLLLTACKSMPAYQAYEGQPRTDNEVSTFSVPEKFNLLAVDGVKYSNSSIRSGAIFKVLPGVHELLIEYQDFWDLGGEEHEKVTSKPIAIRVTTQAGKQYTIDSKILEDVEHAQAFAKKPKITIIDNLSKQSVSAEIKYNRYVGSFLSSLFGPSEAVPTQLTETDGANRAVTSSTPSAKDEGKALEMLKYWWETANKNQQDSFQQWLKK